MIRLLATLALAGCCGSVWGAPFQNGSFEGTNPCNTFDIPAGSTLIPGWTVSVGNIDWESAPGCGWQPSNGSNSLDLVGQLAGGVGGIRQTFDTIPGTAYRVSFDLAGNYGAGPVIKPLAVTIDGVTSNFTFDTTGRSQFNMGWTTHTINFVASSTSTTIDFVSDVSASGGSLNAGAALDNVQVLAAFPAAAAAAPVPLDWAQWAAALLLAIGGASLARRRRVTR